MQSNIGKTDRLIRTELAFVIIFSGIYISGMWVIFGIVVLLTVIMGWCPIYALFRRSTPKEHEEIPPDTSGQHQSTRGPKRLLK